MSFCYFTSRCLTESKEERRLITRLVLKKKKDGVITDVVEIYLVILTSLTPIVIYGDKDK